MSYKSVTDGWLNPKWRQRLVDSIVFLWPIMPMKFRIWAFMNDGDLKDDYKFNNNS